MTVQIFGDNLLIKIAVLEKKFWITGIFTFEKISQ